MELARKVASMTVVTVPTAHIIIIIIIIALQNAQRGKKIEVGLVVISSDMPRVNAHIHLLYIMRDTQRSVLFIYKIMLSLA